VEPSAGGVWGPHGSNRNYILKGEWTGTSQDGSNGTDFLCIKCHSSGPYIGQSQDKTHYTAFYNGARENLHAYHDEKAGSTYRCLSCHVAVPHGWKNRSFLVNLNDIGPEAMCRTVDASPTGYNVQVAGPDDGKGNWPNCNPGEAIPPGSVVMGDPPYTNPPYYVNARLRISNFTTEGSNWSESDCASQSNMTSDMC